VDIEPQVTVLTEPSLPGVDSYAHPDRPVSESPLRLLGSSERLRGLREGDKERITLRVDLDPTVTRERLAKLAAMVGKQLVVALT
jgi:hypothetical protein